MTAANLTLGTAPIRGANLESVAGDRERADSLIVPHSYITCLAANFFGTGGRRGDCGVADDKRDADPLPVYGGEFTGFLQMHALARVNGIGQSEAHKFLANPKD